MPLTIIGLGAGDAEDITRRAWHTLEHATHIYLRTARHPCVPHLPNRERTHSFDALYERHERFEDVYAEITRTLLSLAVDAEVVYAVPGDPFVAESTVSRIRTEAAAAGVALQIYNAVSFIEPTCAVLGIDALDGLQLLDALDVAALHHPPINPSYPVLLAQVYSPTIASNVKLTLMNQYPDDFLVTLVHSAGANGTLETLPLYELDRSTHINHLTSLYVPALGKHSSFESFQETIAHLRAPEGCPWDREQTHLSLRPYLIEEAYEVLDALQREDTAALLDELGDLLLQIVLHTQIATEDGEFNMTDVLQNVNAKMVRRHPHVWGDADAATPDAVVVNWDAIKRAERAAKGEPTDEFRSVLADVPASFSALMRAQKYASKAAKQGFDYDDMDGVRAKIHEELAELDSAADDDERFKEAGDLVFAVVDLLRWLNIDAEAALQATNSKFARRFAHVERRALAAGKPISAHTLAELDVYWQEAKHSAR